MANLLKKKFIGDDQIDGLKVLLENGQAIRIKDSLGAIKEVLKVNGSDKVVMSDAPLITNEGTEANSAQTKSQLDAAVAAEAQLRSDADAALQVEIDNAEAAIAQETSDRQAADALLIPLSQKGAANGVATLDASGLIPSAQLPSYVDDVLEFADLASFPATGETGKIYVAIDDNRQYRWSGSTYVQITSGAVDSVNGKTGVVVLDTDDVSEGASNKYFTDARAIAALQPKNDSQDASISSQGNRITALEAIVWEKQKFVLTSTDITNGYIDLGFESKAGSLSVMVDRLNIHEGASEDYTLSVVASKTRITFVNSMVSPGSEALSAGDNIYVKYQR